MSIGAMRGDAPMRSDAEPTKCRRFGCNATLPPRTVKPGRVRVYCSDACRQAHYYATTTKAERQTWRGSPSRGIFR